MSTSALSSTAHPSIHSTSRATTPTKTRISGPQRSRQEEQQQAGIALLKALSELDATEHNTSSGQALEQTLEVLLEIAPIPKEETVPALQMALSEARHPLDAHWAIREILQQTALLDALQSQNTQAEQIVLAIHTLVNDTHFLEACWSQLETHEQTTLLDVLQSPVCIQLLAQAIREHAPSIPLLLRSWRLLLLKESSKHACNTSHFNRLDRPTLETILQSLHAPASSVTPHAAVEEGAPSPSLTPAMPPIFHKIRAEIWKRDALTFINTFENKADSTSKDNVKGLKSALKALFQLTKRYPESDAGSATFTEPLKEQDIFKAGWSKLTVAEQSKLLDLLHSPLGIEVAAQAMERLPSDRAFLQDWRFLLAQESFQHSAAKDLNPIPTARLQIVQKWLDLEAEKTQEANTDAVPSEQQKNPLFLHKSINTEIGNRTEAALLTKFKSLDFLNNIDAQTIEQLLKALSGPAVPAPHDAEQSNLSVAQATPLPEEDALKASWSTFSTQQQTALLDIVHSPEAISLLAQANPQKSAHSAFVQTWRFLSLQESSSEHFCAYDLDALDLFTIERALKCLRLSTPKAVENLPEQDAAQSEVVSDSPEAQAIPPIFHEKLNAQIRKHAQAELGKTTESVGTFYALTEQTVVGEAEKKTADAKNYLTDFLEGKLAKLDPSFLNSVPYTHLLHIHRWTTRWAKPEFDAAFRTEPAPTATNSASVAEAISTFAQPSHLHGERIQQLHAALTQHLAQNVHLQKVEAYLAELEAPINVAITDFKKACSAPSNAVDIQQKLDKLKATLTPFWSRAVAQRFHIFSSNKITDPRPDAALYKALDTLYQKAAQEKQNRDVHPMEEQPLPWSLYDRLQGSVYSRLQSALKTVGDAVHATDTESFPDPASTTMWPASPLSQFVYHEIGLVLSNLYEVSDESRESQMGNVLAALSNEQLDALHHMYEKLPFRETAPALRASIQEAVLHRLNNGLIDLKEAVSQPIHNALADLESGRTSNINLFEKFQSVLQIFKTFHTPALDVKLEQSLSSFAPSLIAELQKIPIYIENFYTAIKNVPVEFWARFNVETLKENIRILTEPNRYTSLNGISSAVIRWIPMGKAVREKLEANCIQQVTVLYSAILNQNADDVIAAFERFFSTYEELALYSFIPFTTKTFEDYIKKGIYSVSAADKNKLYSILSTEVFEKLSACLQDADNSIKANHPEESKKLRALSDCFAYSIKALASDNIKAMQIEALQSKSTFQDYQAAVKKCLHIDLSNTKNNIHRVLKGLIPNAIIKNNGDRFKATILNNDDEEAKAFKEFMARSPFYQKEFEYFLARGNKAEIDKILPSERDKIFEKYIKKEIPERIILRSPYKIAEKIEISSRFLLDINRQNFSNIFINGNKYDLSYEYDLEEKITTFICALQDFCKNQDEFLFISEYLCQESLLAINSLTPEILRLPESSNSDRPSIVAFVKNIRFCWLDRQPDNSVLFKLSFKYNGINYIQDMTATSEHLPCEAGSFYQSNIILKLDTDRPNWDERVTILQNGASYDYHVERSTSEPEFSPQQAHLASSNIAASSSINMAERLQHVVASAKETAVLTAQNLSSLSTPIINSAHTVLKQILRIV